MSATPETSDISASKSCIPRHLEMRACSTSVPEELLIEPALPLLLAKMHASCPGACLIASSLHGADAVAADCALTWANARAYNQDGSAILAACDAAEAALCRGWAAAGLPRAGGRSPDAAVATAGARAPALARSGRQAGRKSSGRAIRH